MNIRPYSPQLSLATPIVQRVFAIGKPPEDKICFFRDLKNVVVLPAVGAYEEAPKFPLIDVSAVRSLR